MIYITYKQHDYLRTKPPAAATGAHFPPAGLTGAGAAAAAGLLVVEPAAGFEVAAGAAGFEAELGVLAAGLAAVVEADDVAGLAGAGADDVEDVPPNLEAAAEMLDEGAPAAGLAVVVDAAGVEEVPPNLEAVDAIDGLAVVVVVAAGLGTEVVVGVVVVAGLGAVVVDAAGLAAVVVVVAAGLEVAAGAGVAAGFTVELK